MHFLLKKKRKKKENPDSDKFIKKLGINKDEGSMGKCINYLGAKLLVWIKFRGKLKL